MPFKKRRPAPMIVDGLPQAIRNLRKLEGLTQEEAAIRGGLEPHQKGKWSDYETRKKRLGPRELAIITRGLGCDKYQLWQEQKRVEERLLREDPDAVDEPAAGYDTSPVAAYVASLYRLDATKLPPAERDWFHGLRNALVAQIASTFELADRFKARYRQMTQNSEDAP